MLVQIDRPKTNLSNLSDEEIVRRIRAGQISKAQGIEELITRRTPTLWRHLARRYALDEQMLGDIVAETVVIIWENFERYDPNRGRFMSWAIGIAHNKMRETLRQTQRQQEISAFELDGQPEDNLYQFLASTKDDPTAQIDYKELETKTLALVMSFSELDRTLFLLKGNYDLTFEELSSMLNKSGYETTPDAVAKRFYRMRQKLKALYQKRVTQ